MSLGDQKGEHLKGFNFSMKTREKGAVREGKQGVGAAGEAEDNWTVCRWF